MKEMTEFLIKDYLKVLIGEDFEVEIEEETVVIAKEYFYHIYVSDSGFLFIGTATVDDLDKVNRIKDLMPAILGIYHRNDTL